MSTQIRALPIPEVEHVDLARHIVASNLGPHASEAIDLLLSLMRTGNTLQKFVKEATNLAAVIILAFKADYPGSEDWLEEILGKMVELVLPSIRDDSPLT